MKMLRVRSAFLEVITDELAKIITSREKEVSPKE